MQPLTEQNEGSYRFGEFEVDPVRRVLLKDGKPVGLKPKVFETLLVLVRNGGRVMEKDELMRHLWPDTVVEEVNLAHNISVLRKMLGQKTDENRFIVTVPGRGYGFVAEVIQVQRSVSASSTQTEYELIRSRVIVEEETNESDPAELPGRILDAERLRPESLVSVASSGETRRFQLERPARFILGSIFAVLIFAAGLLVWRNYSKHDARDRSATISFAESKIKQLTTKGNVRWLALSRDGTFYAYTLTERDDRNESLWIAQTDGSKEVQLRPPEDAAYHGLTFSADERALYFTETSDVRAENGFFKIPLLGGPAEKLPLTIDGQFALSKDGKQVAFVRTNRDDHSSTLFVANLDGTGLRDVISRPADNALSLSAAWSPDGSLIAVAAINDAAKESREVFVVRLSDGQISQLTAHDWTRVSNLVWLPDGQGLIIVAADSSDMRQLWRVDYPGGTAHRFSRDTDGYGTALSISADGNSLTAVQSRRESNIWIAPIDNLSAAKQVTFSSFNGLYGFYGFDWTPDDRIVFAAGIDRSLAIYSMDSDGSHIKQLTSPGFYDQHPKSTEDGRFIVFQSNRNGSVEIWRVDIDGTDARQLTAGGRNSSPDPTPDSKWVVYASVREGKSLVFRIPIDGGEPVRVTGSEANYPQVSPDGRVIACECKVDSGSHWQLAIIRLEDGVIEKLFDEPRTATFSDGIRWTRDGQAFCYRDSNSGIWRQQIDGGAPQKLAGLPQELIFPYGWSRDGKRFAFTRGRSISDAVLISSLK